MTETISKYWGGVAPQLDTEGLKMPLLHLGVVSRDEFDLYSLGVSTMVRGGLGSLQIEETDLYPKPIVFDVDGIQTQVRIEVRGDNKDNIPDLLKIVNFLKAMRHNAVAEKKKSEEINASLMRHADWKVASIKQERQRTATNGF